MFDSQTIQMVGTTSTVLYSPWFPRGGDYGLFTLEVAAIQPGGGSGLKLTAVLLHKNASDPGDGSAAVGGTAGNIERTSAGRTTIDYTKDIGSSPAFGGFKELVRYQFTLSGSSTTGTSWATFRMLAPVWYDKV